MKILVLGGNGMAGHMIRTYLSEQGYDVWSFSRSASQFSENNILGDALNPQVIKDILLEGDYDFVINCIGILNQFAEANPHIAVYLNSYLPHFIADIIANSKTRLIHMSTDCVFAGNTGPYNENSLRDGKTFYDRSKALGEVDDNRNLTFRNSIIGPDPNTNGIGLLNWFMKQSGDIKGFSHAIWTGVTTLTLAKAMDQAMKENLTGLYNLVNNESINKCELLKLFENSFNKNNVNIFASDELKLDKSLRNTRSDFSFQVPSYQTMLEELKQWVDAHPELYPSFYFDNRDVNK